MIDGLHSQFDVIQISDYMRELGKLAAAQDFLHKGIINNINISDKQKQEMIKASWVMFDVAQQALKLRHYAGSN